MKISLLFLDADDEDDETTVDRGYTSDSELYETTKRLSGKNASSQESLMGSGEWMYVHQESGGGFFVVASSLKIRY